MSGANRGNPGDEPSPDGQLQVVSGRPWRDLGERVVLFDQRSGVETVLSGSGVLLWRMIVPSRDLEELSRELVELLGNDSPELHQAMEFIERLIADGVLRRG